LRLRGPRPWSRVARIAVASLACCPGLVKAQEGPSPAITHSPVLIGYFPQWGAYNQYFVKNLVSSGAAGLLEQIDYSQGMIADNRCSVGDPNADLNLVYAAGDSVDGKADDPSSPFRGNFHQLQELRQRYPKLKMLISIEGKPEGFAAAARPENRAAFVSSCIEMFLRGHLAPGVEGGRIFDGIDLDWEYPGPADKDNYLGLLTEFRRQLDALHQGMTLNIATAAALSHYQGFDMKSIAAQVDAIGVMNYDYNGPWSHRTGILAPLYEIPGDPLSGNTVDATIQAYEQAGVPASKLLMGLPFYAYGWEGVPDVGHGLFQPGSPIRGDHFYSFIQSIKPHFQIYRDPKSEAPWLFDGTTFWSFDDPVSIRAKLEYARKHKLAGVMVWELSNDSADAELLKTIAEGLRSWRVTR
jgi:chitinase